ncbi:MAG: ABC transporter ATP-binding protein [Deltaproteobacteria bacterium]|nr:MAG: ABC transporter ATP-binding protein [Deltaproteobacteria bacterium]
MSITGKNIRKSFGDPSIEVLHGLDLIINDGEFVSISGRSGSGKSTLLYILSTLDKPSSGEIEIDGLNPYELSSHDLHEYRNKSVGFIFQFHYLLPELTALENVLLGPRNLGLQEEYKKRAIELMEEFEIGDQAYKFPSQMSGGQQQRVAIARALIMKPQYIFADEPTGNLDSITGLKVMKFLQKINKEDGTAIVLVTHEPDYAAMAEREIYLIDGKIASRDLDAHV